jgi:hypothetical protein
LISAAACLAGVAGYGGAATATSGGHVAAWLTAEQLDFPKHLPPLRLTSPHAACPVAAAQLQDEAERGR